MTTIAKHRYPHAVFDSSEVFDFIASKSDTDRVMNFLDSLIKTAQIKALRPGIAIFVAIALKEFCKEILTTTTTTALEADYLFVVFFEFLIGRVCRLMCKRKPRLTGNGSVFLAKIGLLMDQSYDAKESTELCNHRDYLENQLFYICNPTTADNWAFVTVKLDKKSITSSTTEAKSTHFRREELITALARFLVPSSSTVSSILQPPHQSNYGSCSGRVCG